MALPSAVHLKKTSSMSKLAAALFAVTAAWRIGMTFLTGGQLEIGHFTWAVSLLMCVALCNGANASVTTMGSDGMGRKIGCWEVSGQDEFPFKANKSRERARAHVCQTDGSVPSRGMVSRFSP